MQNNTIHNLKQKYSQEKVEMTYADVNVLQQTDMQEYTSI